MFYFYLNNRENLSHSHVSARGTVTGVRRVTSEAGAHMIWQIVGGWQAHTFCPPGGQYKY